LKVEDKLQPKQSHVEQNDGITMLNNKNVNGRQYLAEIKNIFEYRTCPRNNNPLNVRIFQDNSLIIYPGKCHIDLCPTIITESDLLSENYREIIISNNKLLKEDNATKEKP